MNKVYLKRFMKDIKEDKKIEQEYKYVKYDDLYLISNNYSVILLNSDYGILKENNGKIADFLRNLFLDFKYHFNLNCVDITEDINNCKDEDETFDFKKEYACDIKDNIINYAVDLKKLNTIKNIIKADKIEINTKWSFNDYCYIVKIENTKTNEIGFLLPIMKV